MYGDRVGAAIKQLQYDFWDMMQEWRHTSEISRGRSIVVYSFITTFSLMERLYFNCSFNDSLVRNSVFIFDI